MARRAVVAERLAERGSARGACSRAKPVPEWCHRGAGRGSWVLFSGGASGHGGSLGNAEWGDGRPACKKRGQSMSQDDVTARLDVGPQRLRSAGHSLVARTPRAATGARGSRSRRVPRRALTPPRPEAASSRPRHGRWAAAPQPQVLNWSWRSFPSSNPALWKMQDSRGRPPLFPYGASGPVT